VLLAQRFLKGHISGSSLKGSVDYAIFCSPFVSLDNLFKQPILNVY
jgi:hypothetical protein